MASFCSFGYELIGYFALPEDTWWIKYYSSLEGCIKELRAQYIHDPEALLILDKEQHEIDISRKYQKWYGLITGSGTGLNRGYRHRNSKCTDESRAI